MNSPSSALPPFLEPLAHNPSLQESDDLPHHARFAHTRSGQHAHTIWWPAAALSPTPPSTILLFIPGNPGLIGFYIPFLSALWEQCSSSNFAILAHSHLGHTPGVGDDHRRPLASAIGLTSQVEAILEVVAAIRSAFGSSPKIVFAAHSVGSWLVLQALKNLPSSEISGTFLLFPTICNIGNTPNGRRLSWLFGPPLPRVISSLSAAIRWLPLRVLSVLFPSWPLAQVSVLRTLLHSPPAIFSTLTMADDEMKIIRDLDVGLLKEHHDRLYYYYAQYDDWVGKERDAVLEALNDAESPVKIVHGHQDIPHAFCINHGQELASQCLEWLRSGGLI